MAEITRQMKREAALREVQMRRRVYPCWVKDGRMTQAVAGEGESHEPAPHL